MARIDAAIGAKRGRGAFSSIPRQPKANTAPTDNARDDAIGREEVRQVEAAQVDPRAFAPLYEAYADLVWRYAMSRLGNHDRAAEAASVTFQKALAALPRYRPRHGGNGDDGSPFRAWLMTIARNAVIDEARRERHAPSLDDPAVQPWLVDGARSPEDLAIASDERRRVERALARLPATQRRIVELRLIGMKSAEIADILGMTPSAVDTAHFRAYARLREWLADPAGTEDDGGPAR